MHVAEIVLRDARRRIVPPAFRCAVAGEMLGAGRDTPGQSGVFPLQAVDHRDPHAPGQQGILAEALGDPAPPGIPGHVDHGRKRPVQARRRGLAGRRPGSRPHDLGVPRRRLAQGDRHHRREPVDDVPADQQRDPQPALLRGDALEFPNHLRVHLVEHRADPAGPNGVAKRFRHAGPSGVDLAHLPDLLVEGHPPDEVRDSLFDAVVVWGGGLDGGLPGGRLTGAPILGRGMAELRPAGPPRTPERRDLRARIAAFPWASKSPGPRASVPF